LQIKGTILTKKKYFCKTLKTTRVLNVSANHALKYLLHLGMDKLQLTGQNLGWVYNFRSGHLHAAQFWCYQ